MQEMPQNYAEGLHGNSEVATQTLCTERAHQIDMEFDNIYRLACVEITEAMRTCPALKALLGSGTN